MLLSLMYRWVKQPLDPTIIEEPTINSEFSARHCTLLHRDPGANRKSEKFVFLSHFQIFHIHSHTFTHPLSMLFLPFHVSAKASHVDFLSDPLFTLLAMYGELVMRQLHQLDRSKDAISLHFPQKSNAIHAYLFKSSVFLVQSLE